jgi:chloramphenicol O-acetyltransferase
MKSEWRIVVTYNSDKPMKYCELNYTYFGTSKTLENKIWKHYNENYEDYGKAEAVEVELIRDNIDK